ncbi:hypothetical protein NNO_0724 [Hydrogenimonas sp.]|nr:hypothetical protein NNO_0724 [Hydrogenimonas sp.]
MIITAMRFGKNRRHTWRVRLKFLPNRLTTSITTISIYSISGFGYNADIAETIPYPGFTEDLNLLPGRYGSLPYLIFE